MKNVQTKAVDKSKYANFLSKADSFYRAMEGAESDENWNAASLNAIHCVISSSDALTTYILGERPAGKRHGDAAALLKATNAPESQEKARWLLDIIARKTLIEYEPEEPTEAEARQIIKQARRFHNWVKQLLQNKQLR